MRIAKRNLKKAAAGAEAPRQSVQSAKQVAKMIGGISEYRAMVAATIEQVCAAFNGRILSVEGVR